MLSFGQIAVELAGSTELCADLMSFCQGFESETVDLPIKVVLKMEKKPLLLSMPNFSGWRPANQGINQQVLYSSNGKNLFSLQYETHTNNVTVSVDSQANSALRIAAQYGLMLALHQHCIGLHCVTLLCGNDIVMLSAPSGTGKTTLAHLLEKYCDSIVLNGDFALLTPTKNGVMFEPTPFCGTSGRSLNHRVRVNRVVFLEQSPNNVWRELTGREAMARFMSNSFVPTWDMEMQHAVQENILKCVSEMKTNAFSFAPTSEAAKIFFSQLQTYEE